MNLNHSKVLVMLALTTISCATVSGISTPSQAKAAAQPTISKDFWPFWAGFKEALRKNDKNALADMTKFPYMLHQDTKLDRAAFIKRSEEVFPASARKCLQREKPVPDQNEVFVFCGDDIYIFAKDQGKFKFTEIGVND